MAIDTKPLDPGAVLHASHGGMTHALKLSALLRPVGTQEVLGLVGRGITSAPAGARVTFGLGPDEGPIGQIEEVGDSFPDAGKLDPLFQIVRFDEDLAARLRIVVIDAAVSKNMAQNVLSKGLLRVRKLNAPISTSRGVKNYVPIVRDSRGFLTGNVVRPIIARRDGKVMLDRAGVARGRGKREFAWQGDSGAPVLSASGALLGFVVGRDAKRTLVLPAEDVMKRMAIDFVVAKDGSGPANYTRIRRRRPVIKSFATAAE